MDGLGRLPRGARVGGGVPDGAGSAGERRGETRRGHLSGRGQFAHCGREGPDEGCAFVSCLPVKWLHTGDSYRGDWPLRVHMGPEVLFWRSPSHDRGAHGPRAVLHVADLVAGGELLLSTQGADDPGARTRAQRRARSPLRRRGRKAAPVPRRCPSGGCSWGPADHGHVENVPTSVRARGKAGATWPCPQSVLAATTPQVRGDRPDGGHTCCVSQGPCKADGAHTGLLAPQSTVGA